MSNKLFPIMASDSKSLWMMRWTPLGTSNTTMLAQATPTKVIKFGCTPFCCICQNSYSVFYPCLDYTCPNIMVIQVTTFENGMILLNIFQTYSMLPHFANILTEMHVTNTNKDVKWQQITCNTFNFQFKINSFCNTESQLCL